MHQHSLLLLLYCQAHLLSPNKYSACVCQELEALQHSNAALQEEVTAASDAVSRKQKGAACGHA